jgi:hypothetical protein
MCNAQGIHLKARSPMCKTGLSANVHLGQHTMNGKSPLVPNNNPESHTASEGSPKFAQGKALALLKSKAACLWLP